MTEKEQLVEVRVTSYGESWMTISADPELCLSLGVVMYEHVLSRWKQEEEQENNIMPY